MPQPKKILVTGCAGFIGSQVCRTLLEQGAEVVGIDNLNEAYAAALKNWRIEQLARFPKFKFHREDIRESAKLAAVADGAGPFEAIIHLAAYAGVRPSVNDPWRYVDTNINGTLNLLDLAQKRGIKKFVLASTSSLYGNEKAVPYQEDQCTDFSLSPYASSKKSAELFCYNYHYLYGLDVTVFRYFTVYGPAGRPDMSLFRFVQKIIEGRPVTLFGDGEQARDFTYIDDIVDGTLLGLKSVGYRVFNLGSDQPVTVNTVLRTVEKLTGKKATIKHDAKHSADVDRTWANIARAKKELGWAPKWSLEKGVTELVKWYEANRQWAKEVPTQD